METYFLATIMFRDNGDIMEDVLFKNGDVGDDDDEIFFYVYNDNEMEELKSENTIQDFVVLEYKKI